MTDEFENSQNEYTQAGVSSEPIMPTETEEHTYVENFNNEQKDTNFIMMDNHAEDESAAKARQQAEKEKAKFEAKRMKTAAKMEKKKAKKAAKKEKGHGIVFKTVSLVVCAAAFGVISLGTMYFTGDALGILNKDSKGTTKIAQTSVGTSTSGETSTLQTSVNTSTSDSVIATDVSGVVNNVMPSVVAITSKQMVQSGMDDWFSYYFGGNSGNNSGYQEQTGAGSGIIIGQNDTELLIVTNNHVVDGADSLQIQFIDNETVDAVIKGTNADKDLAVVAVKLSDIKESTKQEIKVATMGDSDELKVGEGTIAIGNALGYGQSVTTGVVSALNREVQYENKTMTLIQTDAAINPGNSGGALLNTKGEVIGINAAKYSSSSSSTSVEGMGFAIPVSSVKDVIENLMNKETLTKVDSSEKGYLNIYGRDVTDDLSQMYSVPTGVYILEVMEGGAAEKAGIDKSDVITEINGESVSSMEELQEKLEYYAKGTKVTLTVQYLKDKEYVEKEVEVTLGGEIKE